MRVVLDTVIFVRALISPAGASGRVLDRTSEFVILASPEIAEELLSVLARPDLQERYPQMAASPQLDRALALLASAEVVYPAAAEPVCRDPNDDKFFAAALAGGADYIVSEDNDVLAVAEYGGARTVTAEQFLSILEAR